MSPVLDHRNNPEDLVHEEFARFIIKTSVLLRFIEQGALIEKSGIFLQWGNKALHCVRAVFCAGISMPCIQALFIGLLAISATSFSCTWFHKLRDFTLLVHEYRQWITTQNVRKRNRMRYTLS